MAEVLKWVDALAEKLGVGADALWAILLKQARIAFISDMVILAAVCIGWWVLLHHMIPAVQRAMGAHQDRAVLYGAASVICCIVLLITSLVFLFSLGEILASVFNPEYWAFQQIVRIVRIGR